MRASKGTQITPVRCHRCRAEIYTRINMKQEREWLTYTGKDRRKRLTCGGKLNLRHSPGQQP